MRSKSRFHHPSVCTTHRISLLPFRPLAPFAWMTAAAPLHAHLHFTIFPFKNSSISFGNEPLKSRKVGGGEYDNAFDDGYLFYFSRTTKARFTAQQNHHHYYCVAWSSFKSYRERWSSHRHLHDEPAAPRRAHLLGYRKLSIVRTQKRRLSSWNGEKKEWRRGWLGVGAQVRRVSCTSKFLKCRVIRWWYFKFEKGKREL